MTFDTWESYFYPFPDDQTLRNLLDERDPDVLRHREYGRTAERMRELQAGEVSIPRTYDAEHLRAIHGHLFQDVYEWAGEYRTITPMKGTSVFAEPDQISTYLEDANRAVREVDWAATSRDEFAAAAAKTFAYVNMAHPFREGNGRSAKLFMEHVAEMSPWRLDFEILDVEVPGLDGASLKDLWNLTSMLSVPEQGTYEPKPELLVGTFRNLALPRAEGEELAPHPGGPQQSVDGPKVGQAPSYRAKLDELTDRVQQGRPSPEVVDEVGPPRTISPATQPLENEPQHEPPAQRGPQM